MIYCFDIDNTLCYTEGNDYVASIPHNEIIASINQLYELGHTIKLFTARGSVSKKDWTQLTAQQMAEWGVKHHELIMNQKPHYDLLVDDKAISVIEWKKKNNIKKTGFIAGSFDLIHPGYIKMFEDTKNICDELIVGLHSNPANERPHKDSPVHSREERKIILKSIRYVDKIFEYDTERDLYNLLREIKPDIRILGTDYENTKYTGYDLNIPVYFHKRDHNWSCSGLKNKIAKEEQK